MGTLAEIEAAAEALPRSQQEELIAFLAERLAGQPKVAVLEEDPFDKVIGAFAGPREATGRHAEDILYGTDA